MSTEAEQLPHLHLAELTAAQFIDIWKHFDADGRCIWSTSHSPDEGKLLLLVKEI